MFTGLIEEVGTVTTLRRREDSAALQIRCDLVVTDTNVGDSIAVNGCCLTVTEVTTGQSGAPEGFVTEMMGETLQRTALGGLEEGARVNLERALAVGARLGGHMVQGHVDGVARVTAITSHHDWTTVTYELPPDLSHYVVQKGSITVDGTSLTVMAVDSDTFSVGLIPHTMAVTTHGDRRGGDHVNLEVDVIAKYVQRQLAPHVVALKAGSR